MASKTTNGTSSEPVLITGASGFVAAHVLNEFLEHGYSVRGTVRSEESANNVRKTHAKYGDKLSFTIVKDVAAPGAFDEAVKGVQGVIHTASPFRTTNIDNNERDLLIPAIHGTTEILTAIHKYNPNVSRVVITSSFAAMFNYPKGLWPEHTYTEADWNPVTYEEAKASDNGGVVYMASKTLAEKAAWNFVSEKNPGFSVATINPPMIYGPNAHAVSDLKHLNTSSADIYRLINGSEKDVPPTNFFAFVDVRDVALAHRLAYEKPEAGGQRFFTTSGGYSYQEICDIVREEFPELRERTPEGKPGAGAGVETYKVDNGKCRKELGMSFRGLRECIVDTVRTLMELEKSIGKA